MVKSTSRKSFRRLELEPMETAVLYTLKEARIPLNRRQIALRSGLELSNVCGRVNTLIDRGMVVVDGEWKCPITGKTVEFLRPAKSRARKAA